MPAIVLGMENTVVSKPDGPCLHGAQGQRKDEIMHLIHSRCPINVPLFVPFLLLQSQSINIIERRGEAEVFHHPEYPPPPTKLLASFLPIS